MLQNPPGNEAAQIYAIIKHLQEEKKNYTKIIAIECGASLHHVDAALKNNMDYLGIDASPENIDIAKREAARLNKSQTKSIGITHFNISGLKESTYSLLYSANSERPLLIFSFDILKNLATMHLLFENITKLQLDFILSIDKNNPEPIKICEKNLTIVGETPYSFLFFGNNATKKNTKSFTESDSLPRAKL